MTVSNDASERATASLIDFARLEGTVDELRAGYATARPFPHVVIDRLAEPAAAERAADEYPLPETGEWLSYVHVNERKYGNPDLATWGPTLQELGRELTSDRFVAFLGDLTGIDGLFADTGFDGGGLQQALSGGHLNIHADFTVHPHHRHWRRRVNLLLYCNGEWPPEYGGDLELWTADMQRCEQRIAPLGNRAVIFNTDADAFHGHPEPLTSPPGIARRALAVYYFTEDDDPLVRSTEYRARPSDGKRHAALIYVDKQALRVFDRLKRWFGISDRSAAKLLALPQKLRRRPKR